MQKLPLATDAVALYRLYRVLLAQQLNAHALEIENAIAKGFHMIYVY
jgi:class 3 adenylate cyclase